MRVIRKVLRHGANTCGSIIFLAIRPVPVKSPLIVASKAVQSQTCHTEWQHVKHHGTLSCNDSA